MLNNLGNNGEALAILRTETILVTNNGFNALEYIKSVQAQFNGKQVTKMHLKGMKETFSSSPNTDIIAMYKLDGPFGFQPPLPSPSFTVESKVFLLKNFEELEFYGSTNFEKINFYPVFDGQLADGSTYVLGTPSNPPINPSIEDFRLQITLMGL